MIETFKSSDPALVARRYRAERRFRSYGILALLLTSLFLVFLVVDIVAKGIPAFFEHHAIAEIAIDPAKVDPANIRAGDFVGLAKEALRNDFPKVTARSDRKMLLNLLSVGAGDDLRDMVVADPSLIGKKVSVPLLLSDDADLYLKGKVTRVTATAGTGSLAIAEDGEGVTLTSSAPMAAGMIVRANGGVFRVTEVAGGTAKAEMFTPPASFGNVDQPWDLLTFSVPETDRRITDKEAVWLESLKSKGKIEKAIAWRFFTAGDSREPELAGIRGALAGSILTIIVTLILSLPVGVAAAIYLEEFASRNHLTDIIEVNINNLAAVPSIIFGLLGLAVFLNFFNLPRSAALVGGMVLALLVLPTIIIASRAAIRAVPPSIKEAALGVGASHQQAVFQHVLPLAVPGILTGTILGVARAFGETAPLLMIGMVAFIVDIPRGFTDAATVMPVQIFLWSDLPEIAFQSKTAAAIIVLLVVLFLLNALAILLRKRFERRW
jgi:phosphate transport system permease protein